MATELYELFNDGKPTGQYRQMSADEAMAENILLLFAGNGVWQLWESVEAQAVKVELRRLLAELAGGCQ